MNKKLVSKCRSLISKYKGEIGYSTLVKELKKNKEYRTPYQLQQAIEYLRGKIIIVYQRKVIKENFTDKEWEYLNSILVASPDEQKDLYKNLSSNVKNKKASLRFLKENGINIEETKEVIVSDEIFTDDDEERATILAKEYFLLNSDEDDIPMNDIVKDYFNSIRDIPLLTDDELTALVKQRDNGNAIERKKAINRIVEGNLRLVVAIAKHYIYRKVPFMDIIQFGNTGLISAAEKFDLSFNVTFAHYASFWIKQGIYKGLVTESRIIRLPANMAYQTTKNYYARKELLEKNGKMPSNKELADYINKNKIYASGTNFVTEDDIMRGDAFYDVYGITSLDTPVSNDDSDEPESCLYDFIPNTTVASPEEELETEGLKMAVQNALKLLKPRERDMLIWRFGLDGNPPKNLTECAENLNVSRERARQIETNAITTLKKSQRAYDMLVDFCSWKFDIKKIRNNIQLAEDAKRETLRVANQKKKKAKKKSKVQTNV